MAKDPKVEIVELKQARKDLQKLYTDLEKENKRLKGVEEGIPKLQKEVEDLKQANSTFKIDIGKLRVENVELTKKNEELSKNAAPGNEELQAKLDEQTILTEQAVSNAKNLRNHISELETKNKGLVSGDEKNSGLAKDLKEKERENTRLKSDIEGLKKKLAKTEGEFPKLPLPGGMVIAVQLVTEVQMDSDEKLQMHRVELKGGIVTYLQVRIKGDKCIDANFSGLN